MRERNKQRSKEWLDFLECVDVCQKFSFKLFCFPLPSNDILLLHKTDAEFTLSPFKHLHFPVQNKSRGSSSTNSKFTRFFHNKQS